MAESVADLASLILINDRNLADVDVPDFLNRAAFMRTNSATIASHDTIHKWLRYQNPQTGFRDPNDGREVQASADTLVNTDCKILDASFRVDVALALSYRKGGSSGWLNREAARHLSDAFFRAELQVFNGTVGGDAKGFQGFTDLTEYQSIAGGRVSSNAGASVGAQSSIWLVRSGSEDVEIITGRNGDIAIGTPTIQETTGATGTYPAYYTPSTAWYALKVGSTVTSAWRIANVEDSLNDDDIFKAMAKFGSGREPTHIYMNRDKRELLRSSRTATNQTGTPAPLPTEVGGVPVIVTDGILNTEAVVS